MKISSLLIALMVCGIGSIANTTLGCGPAFFAPYQEEKISATPYLPGTECPCDHRFIPMQQSPTSNSQTIQEQPNTGRPFKKNSSPEEIIKLKRLLLELQQRPGASASANQ